MRVILNYILQTVENKWKKIFKISQFSKKYEMKLGRETGCSVLIAVNLKNL